MFQVARLWVVDDILYSSSLKLDIKDKNWEQVENKRSNRLHEGVKFWESERGKQADVVFSPSVFMFTLDSSNDLSDWSLNVSKCLCDCF